MIGLVDGDGFIYFAYWKKDNLTAAVAHLHELIDNAKNENFCDYLAIAVGGSDNWRNDFYWGYKKSVGRENSRKTMPEWLPDLKAELANRPDAILTDNIEADDVIRMWAEQCKAHNKDYIVISHDKDLDCIEGLHFDPRKWRNYHVSEEQSDVSYWKQLLMGDGIDNIPGIKGIGPKKADKLLEGLQTHEERRRLVCQEYYKVYGNEGYANLLANGRLLHIMRHVNDYFSLSKEEYEKAISC